MVTVLNSYNCPYRLPCGICKETNRMCTNDMDTQPVSTCTTASSTNIDNSTMTVTNNVI